MQCAGRLGDELTQRPVEIDQRPPAVFALEKATAGYRHAKHLFNAQRLCAELDFIRPMGFRLAAFVLDRIDDPIPVKLHDIALPGNPESERAHRQAARDAHARLAFIRSIVGLLMKHLSLGGEFVFRPRLLQMDQAALARTIQPMLERGERQELVIGEHGKNRDLTACVFRVRLHT